LAKRYININEYRSIMKIDIICIAIFILLSAFILGCSDGSDKEPVRECSTYALEECPEQCVVCPPCEVCSSISCQSEEFCESIGFNRSWHEEIKKRLSEQQ
jgi:hypothetical protein